MKGGGIMEDILTKRLRLHCQTIEEMERDKDAGDEMAADFYYAYKYHLENEKGYDIKWLRLWDIVALDSDTIIGGACFKGEPDNDGMVEIGYGVADEFQDKGYGFEAIEALIKWAHSQDKVKYVMAEVEKNNIPSLRLVRHLGMEEICRIDNNIYFRK